MKKKKMKFPFKIFKVIALIVLVLTVLYLSFLGIRRFFYTSKYFQVKEVQIDDSIDLSYLEGRNIFSIDLDKISNRISARYPKYQTVRMMRRLPNVLVVEFTERKIEAYIKLYRYFAVDRQGVIFAIEEDDLEFDIPLIIGLETKIFGPKSGKQYRVKELNLALDLITRAKKVKALKDLQIKRIHAADSKHLSFFLYESNVEIKIGEEIKKRLRMLNSLLPHIKSELSSIRYIELRFKEPVIKYK